VFFEAGWGCPYHEDHEESTKRTKKMKWIGRIKKIESA
jgi:hypothetical protein